MKRFKAVWHPLDRPLSVSSSGNVMGKNVMLRKKHPGLFPSSAVTVWHSMLSGLLCNLASSAGVGICFSCTCQKEGEKKDFFFFFAYQVYIFVFLGWENAEMTRFKWIAVCGLTRRQTLRHKEAWFECGVTFKSLMIALCLHATGNKMQLAKK